MNQLITKSLATVVLGVGISGSSWRASAQTLFLDDFQTDSSANWSIYGISGIGVTNDYSAQFAFDYGTQTYRYNGVTNFVPSSPNSGGTTKGLKVTVNKNGNSSIAAVSLYPTGRNFSGDYALKFDLWMDYSGDVPFGDGGSTEFSSFGLNHYGTNVNWPNTPPGGDGVWFNVSGEGGSGRDYRAYVGDPAGGPNTELTGSGGFLDRDNDGTPEQNVPDSTIFSPFQLMFPAPPGQSPGAIGKQWVQVELRQRSGEISWLINGYLIAKHSNNNGFTSGNIMLGYQDPFFNEMPDEPYESYAIFDNVRVIDLTTVDPLPAVDITAPDNDASEPGANTGTFTLTRTGSTAAPLTVNLRISGSASNGVDYVAIANKITFAAGESSTNITVTPINDSIGEPVETVLVSVLGSPTNYDVAINYAIVNITDDSDVPTATTGLDRTAAYENYKTGRYFIRLSNPNSVDTTVHFALTGTAVPDVNYTNLGTTILIPAGETNEIVTLSPINDSIRSSNRTAILTLTAGAGYAISSVSNATMILREDDLVEGPALFADDFNTDSSAIWKINRSQSDGTAIFAYDYSADGIAAAPNSTNGTTKGLKLQVNDTNAVASGLSLSPAGKSFTNDYRLRFDAWINYNGPLFDGGSGSTEFASAGIGTTGTTTNWSGGSGVDGVWFSWDGDGGNGSDYRVWRGGTHLTSSGNPGLYPAGSQAVANSYYAEFGGDPAPASQIAAFPGNQTGTAGRGNPGFAWHDMMINKIGSTVTWYMDGLKIAGLDVSAIPLSTNIFIGYYDPSGGVSPIPDLAFALVDNLRVLTLQRPQITTVAAIGAGAQMQMDFAASPVDTTNSFTLQSSATVNGTYADVNSTVTQIGTGSFRAVVGKNGPAQFYRLRR